MATLMEDVDSESGSQNGLQGVNIEDLAHAKEGSMATRERPGTPREAHSSGCLYHNQTVSITTVTVKVFFIIQMYFLINDVAFETAMIFKIAKFSMHKLK